MGLLERIASDVTYMRGLLRALKRVNAATKDPERTFPDILSDLALVFDERPALIGQDSHYSYREVEARANQYAHWAFSVGLEPGDTVSLLMKNCPEYLAIWFGLIRAGVRVALLNTNLTGHSLGHCMQAVPVKKAIVDTDLLEAHDSALPHMGKPPELWVHGKADHGFDLVAALTRMPEDGLAADRKPKIAHEDPALYIYTSGTTGLPKAAVINHYRIVAAMHGFAAICNSNRDDRIYVAQPMYHTSGGILAVGIALTVGGSVVIRERFSARSFWDDIVETKCTAFQYIGEQCRYLLNAPKTAAEEKHSIRFCNGNGLRPDIWEDFQSRFAIPRIVEWYAATEGNVTLFNLDGTPGSIGRIPRWLERRFPVKVVKFDVETEQPVRDAAGHCVECEAGEVGEAIGKISRDASTPASRFDGYANRDETKKKVLRNVFEKGDAWFRTGDLMRRDKRGYFYFVDRIGDTFRWKGENVSTSEVEEVMTAFPGIRQANVYGVTVPLHNGRAGMAAIVSDRDLDLVALHEHLERELPSYSRPRFLRLLSTLDVTGTFKVKKTDLRAEGFDPRRSADPLYFNNPDSFAFERLDINLYRKIEVGDFRL
ncbi:long-chain-acyl-CoA synthetase [Tepidamorphus sp. 3E244]|uniref:long-chain-acyl-CoA synthetase n=1 Tax=Tepidamorphus sp. 3E244 TaxID=3385498 RepID=UPI0038FCC105